MEKRQQIDASNLAGDDSDDVLPGSDEQTYVLIEIFGLYVVERMREEGDEVVGGASAWGKVGARHE